MSKEIEQINEWDITTALTLYKEFIDKKYYASSDHTIPSEFVARCVKQKAIWLVNLLMGIAFYAIKFDDSTASYFSPELLKKAGYTDPCFSHGLVKREWTQKTSTGKNPMNPQSVKDYSGLSIADYDASGLLDFYMATILEAKLPQRNDKGNLQFFVNGTLKTETKYVLYNNSPLKGWGLQYGNKTLTVNGICWNPDIACEKTIDGTVCLCCKKPDNLSIKCVGASNASKNLASTDREEWYAWSRYYLTGDGSKIDNNILYPAAKWFCSYWAPYYSWGKDNKIQDIDQIMMLSAIANSSPSKARSNLGKPIDTMIESYATDAHRKRRVYNTLRAISIVKYLQDLEL